MTTVGRVWMTAILVVVGRQSLVIGCWSSVRPDRDQRLLTTNDQRLLMRESVDERVDAERVSDAGEALEVGAALALALEGVAVIGVVGDHHEHVFLIVED